MQPDSWQRATVGHEHTLTRACLDARLVFGIGPRFAAGAPAAEVRLEALRHCLGGHQARILWCHQVHGTRIQSIPQGGGRLASAACVGDADGLLATSQGLVLAVWTADCLPVLAVAPGVVAAVHAGWRGLAGGIIESLWRALSAEHPIDHRRVRVFLGPAVGPCHYPVGSEVVDLLAATGVPRSLWLEHDRVDLRALARAQLAGFGLGDDHVELVGGCTACSGEAASFRRDGQLAARQLAAVLLDRARS